MVTPGSLKPKPEMILVVLAFSERFEARGEWWLPGSSEARIPGTLIWSERRASLQLHDAFTPIEGDFYGDEVNNYDAIHGLTVDGHLITVLKGSSVGTAINFGSGGLRQAEKIASSWVVHGAHVESESTYQSIRARIPGLHLWLGRAGVHRTLRPKSDSAPAALLVEFEGVRAQTYEIPSVPCSLGFETDRHFSGDLGSEFSAKTSASLTLSSETPQSIDWFLEQLGKATTLLSFIAGSPMSADALSAAQAGGGATVQALVALRQDAHCAFKHHHEFFLDGAHLEVDLGEMFRCWFAEFDRIQMPSQLTLSIFSSDGLWLHVEFLSLMQALEGFHRALDPGHYVTEIEYKPIQSALVSAIPTLVAPDHRDALKARIKYGNEISLRKRLAALVDRLDPELRAAILGSAGEIPSSWVHTRNYYTHWDETSRSDALDGLEMHRAGVRMKAMLRTLYLLLVGIPASALARALQGPSSIGQYLIQLNGAERRAANPDSRRTPLMSIHMQDSADPSPE